MTIRPATSSDLNAILDLVVDQLDYPDENSLTVNSAMPILVEIQRDPHHHLFVAEENDTIMGTFMLIIVQQLAHGGSRSAIIEDVAVQSAAQGRGVGTRMMSYAVDFAREQGCSKIVLSSGKTRDRAHEFYEKNGYRQHGMSFYLDVQ